MLQQVNALRRIGPRHQELEHSLSAILGVSGGTVEWHLLPLYPTPGHFINLLFFTPEMLQQVNTLRRIGPRHQISLPEHIKRI